MRPPLQFSKWDRIRLAIYLGRGQTIAALGGLRHRSRDYANHHVMVDKHPHTGRVLRTVRCAVAANYLGPDFWARASDAALDACCAADQERRGLAYWQKPEPIAPWTHEGPVNLLRCEE